MPHRHRIGHPPAWSTEKTQQGEGVEAPALTAPAETHPGQPPPKTEKTREPVLALAPEKSVQKISADQITAE